MAQKKKLSFRKSEVQNAHFLADKLQKHKFIKTVLLTFNQDSIKIFQVAPTNEVST